MKEYFLADDLSGALDAAAAFHRAGRRVRVELSPDGWTMPGDGDVVGVTTETRNLAPALAAAVVERTLARGRAQGARLVYKKIDSTLRGPVAAEVAAVARGLPAARILFTPANPAVGRTVRDGRLLVRGVPVNETEYARDPVCPVRECDIRKLLAEVEGGRVIVADAESEGDLSAAVAGMVAAGGEWIAIGSGALAIPVAALAARNTQSPMTAARLPGPVLMLCGSAHAGNRGQAEALSRQRGVPWRELRISEPGVAVRAVMADLRATGGGGLLVEAARGDSAEVRKVVADAASEVVATLGVRRVFATGGETAFALCGRLGVTAFDFVDEIEPGLGLARAEAEGGAMLFAIKPGGFGSADTWVRAWDRLQAG